MTKSFSCRLFLFPARQEDLGLNYPPKIIISGFADYFLFYIQVCCANANSAENSFLEEGWVPASIYCFSSAICIFNDAFCRPFRHRRKQHWDPPPTHPESFRSVQDRALARRVSTPLRKPCGKMAHCVSLCFLILHPTMLMAVPILTRIVCQLFKCRLRRRSCCCGCLCSSLYVCQTIKINIRFASD